ncbi:MAG: CBS domain-containing protein [Candidatus Eremiobacteraeota bacterium]|nr:CBS domain-containing protein [Candidatus Eremiobacteraeota bacterium]
MKVRDIMETVVITVPPDEPVKKVAKLLVQHDVTAIPVVDKYNKILGIVSEEDLVYRLAHPHLPPHIELLGGVIYLENPFEMKHELKKLTAITAGEIMTDKVFTVTGDAEVEDVATLMIENDVNGIPVVREGKILGIVTRHDIVMTLAKSEPNEENEKKEDKEESEEEDTTGE